MKEKVKILAINPGSTSTKVAVYENEERVFAESVFFSTEELEKYSDSLTAQRDFRASGVEAALNKAGIDPASFDVVVGRGGGLWGIKTGAYEVTDFMLEFQYGRPGPWHASVFGGMIAQYFADKSGCKAYIYDATGADEMIDVARVTGFKGVYRRGGGHVLNQRACAIKYAKQVGRPLSELRLIVAHIGGGTTFMAFEDGRMADNIGDVEGTFSPERSGPLQPDLFLDLFLNSGMTKKEMQRLIRGKGGLVALLGTNSALDVEKMIENGDKKAELVYDAMCYRIAKSIGGLVAAPLKGDVDAIIVTGSIAYSKRVVDTVVGYIKTLAKEIVVYPGENELESLAMGGLRVHLGEETAHVLQAEELNPKFSLE